MDHPERMLQRSPSTPNRLGYKHLTLANSSGDAAYKFKSGKTWDASHRFRIGPVRGLRPISVLRGRTLKTPKPHSSMRHGKADSELDT
jgi:hypothetical protein